MKAPSSDFGRERNVFVFSQQDAFAIDPTDLHAHGRLNLAGIAFLGFRYLQVNVEELVSLTNVVIEIRKVRLELQRLQVTFDFVIADPNIDDWDPAVEELNGPQVNSRLTSFPNPAPTIISATPEYVQSTGEGMGAVLDVVAESPLGSGFDWVAQVSPHGENAWIPWTFNSVNSDMRLP